MVGVVEFEKLLRQVEASVLGSYLFKPVPMKPLHPDHELLLDLVVRMAFCYRSCRRGSLSSSGPRAFTIEAA